MGKTDMIENNSSRSIAYTQVLYQIMSISSNLVKLSEIVSILPEESS
jgi:hypothetical protein